jgi:hypothetical protein
VNYDPSIVTLVKLVPGNVDVDVDVDVQKATGRSVGSLESQG